MASCGEVWMDVELCVSGLCVDVSMFDIQCCDSGCEIRRYLVERLLL